MDTVKVNIKMLFLIVYSNRFKIEQMHNLVCKEERGEVGVEEKNTKD